MSRHSWRLTQIFPADDQELSLILSFLYRQDLNTPNKYNNIQSFRSEKKENKKLKGIF